MRPFCLSPLALGMMALVFALPAVTSTPASQIHIVGRVTDASTGSPLAGARVVLVASPSSTVADGQGEFDLVVGGRGLIGTQVTIRVSSIGYDTDSRTVTIADSVIREDFALTPSVIRLDEVVVAADAAQAQPGRVSARAAMQIAPSAGALARWRDPNYNREAYAHIAENEFAAVGANPISTFSIDVDRASYSNVRRFIRSRQRPPIDAVRIEELINYFTYDYPDPTGEHPFAVTTEVQPAPWNELHKLVRIGLRSPSVGIADLPPSNLVFLLDVSGSMQSQNKLPLLKSSFRLLVNELREEDRVAIVVYAGAAGLVLESTPGNRSTEILEAIERLEAGGSTAGGAGLRLAYEVARKNHIEGGNNRVILATDGDFNVGPSSDSEMIRLIEEKREQGTFLTVLGFGTGNIQDAKMEQIADHGNGNFAYIDNLMEAKKVLVTEMGGTLLTVAKDVKIQVEFNPAHVQAYRLIGYENRLLDAEDFNDDTKDAGELGAGHTVTALYEIIPVGVDSPVEIRGIDSLRYQTTAPRTGNRNSPELMFVKLRYKDPDGSTSRLMQHAVLGEPSEPTPDFGFVAAVAGFGMLLRDSEHCGDLTLDDVIALAADGRGADAHGYRSEFIELVRETRALGLLGQ